MFNSAKMFNSEKVLFKVPCREIDFEVCFIFSLLNNYLINYWNHTNSNFFAALSIIKIERFSLIFYYNSDGFYWVKKVHKAYFLLKYIEKAIDILSTYVS